MSPLLGYKPATSRIGRGASVRPVRCRSVREPAPGRPAWEVATSGSRRPCGLPTWARAVGWRPRHPRLLALRVRKRQTAKPPTPAAERRGAGAWAAERVRWACVCAVAGRPKEGLRRTFSGRHVRPTRGRRREPSRHLNDGRPTTEGSRPPRHPNDGRLTTEGSRPLRHLNNGRLTTEGSRPLRHEQRKAERRKGVRRLRRRGR